MRKAFLLTILISFFLFPRNSFATWYKYPNNPILDLGRSDNWDSNQVGSPYVLFDGQNWKMWYEGKGSSGGFQIGYITSTDGVSWTNAEQPTILSGNQNEDSVHDPKIVINGSNFYTWNAAQGQTFPNFHINFSTSANETNWVMQQQNTLPATYQWESGLGVSHPFVLQDNGIFKMWYSANGFINNTQQWSVGYAESNDGKVWIKNPTPVVSQSQSWESINMGAATVIKENSVYKMWYHGARDIGMASSTDGINWIKDSNNPIIFHGSSFDSVRMLNPYIIKKDNIYYLYYTGEALDGHWRIGLATSEPIPIPPSPTPTPSAPPKSPIVIAVGMGASLNTIDFLSCNTNFSHTWDLNPAIHDYDRLINTLTNQASLQQNNDFYVYTYDWRQTLPRQKELFDTYLTNILQDHPAGAKITVVAHSFGGLVTRSYLDAMFSDHRIQKVMTVGTPHKGAVSAYRLWEAGQYTDDILWKRILMKLLIDHCGPHINKALTSRIAIHLNVPSIQQLLPVFPYLKDKQNNFINPSSMQEQNDWIPSHPFPNDAYGIPFFTLSGENQATEAFLNVIPPSKLNQLHGDWIDGKPTSTTHSSHGDGTVLDLSSQINTSSVTNESIEESHRALMYSDAGIQKILEYLGLGSITPSSAIYQPDIFSTQSLTITSNKKAHISLNIDNQIIDSDTNILTYYDPKTNRGIITITPEESGEYLIDIVTDDRSYEEPTSSLISRSLIKGKEKKIQIQIFPKNQQNPILEER